jgi:heptosyltransferase-1
VAQVAPEAEQGQHLVGHAQLRAQLREQPYDLILDLQGLLKSALWARQAIGPVAGFDSASAREPAACWWYQRKAAVPRNLHAVERCRRLAAAHLGYALPTTEPDFGLQAPPPTWGAPDRYAVLIPNASRAEKLWPESRWVAVGKRLHDRGWKPVVLWGSPASRRWPSASPPAAMATCHRS